MTVKPAMGLAHATDNTDVSQEFDTQMDAIKQFAESNGYEIVFPMRMWTRNRANIDERDFRDQVTNCRASDYSALIAYSPDRLTTDPVQLQQFKKICLKEGIELLFVNPTEETEA